MNLSPPTRFLIVAALASAVGWLASAAWHGLEPLRYAETLHGTVSLVSADGTKLCLEPDEGGGQRCGVVGPPSTTAPAVGDRLTIVVGWLRVSAELEEEFFVIAAAPEGGG